MKQASYSTAKTVQKAFTLLELIGEKQPASTKQIVEELKLTRSNVHRLLSTLERIGYIEKSADSTYRLGFKIFMLGSSILKRNQLFDVAHPFMFRLAELTQENVNLAILYQKKVLYVKKIESPQYLKLDKPIGTTDPLHCTALGKVLLSGLEDQELKQFCKSTKLTPYTKNTITEPSSLLSTIQEVRKGGFAVDLQEVIEGVHCIAAPIRDHTTGIVAALSVSAPAFRLPREKMDQLKALLLETCSNISSKMGYVDKKSINKQE